MEIQILGITNYILNIHDMETKKFKSVKKRLLNQGYNIDINMNTKIAKSEKLDQEEVKDLSSDIPRLLNANKEQSQIRLVKEKGPKVKFKTKSELEIRMEPLSAQVSMDDLYTIITLQNQVQKEGMDISKLWSDYTETQIETEADKARKIEQDVPAEFLLDFQSEQGVDVVIINEDKGNFVPMLLFQCDKVTYN